MTNTTTIDDLTAELRRRATEGMSGSDALNWLTGQGLSDDDARTLCAQVIREIRPADGLTDADKEALTRVADGDLYLTAPADGYSIGSDHPLSFPVAQAARQMLQNGLVNVAYRVRGENYPSEGWPSPLVLTEAGETARADIPNNIKEH